MIKNVSASVVPTTNQTRLIATRFLSSAAVMARASTRPADTYGHLRSPPGLKGPWTAKFADPPYRMVMNASQIVAIQRFNTSESYQRRLATCRPDRVLSGNNEVCLSGCAGRNTSLQARLITGPADRSAAGIGRSGNRDHR